MDNHKDEIICAKREQFKRDTARGKRSLSTAIGATLPKEKEELHAPTTETE